MYSKNYYYSVLSLLVLSVNLEAKTEAVSSKSKTSKPKILVLTKCFPERSATAVLNQITGLIDNGLDVYIFARQEGDMQALNIHPDIIAYRLFERTYVNDLPVDLDTYDVFLCESGRTALWFAPIKKEFNLRGKLVTAFRGLDASRLLADKPHIYDDLFENGDLFLPCSDHFAQRLIQHGCPEEKVKVQYTSIDCTKFVYKPHCIVRGNKVRLISVCRLMKRKGVRFLIEAINILVNEKKMNNIELVIVGFGSQEEELKNLVHQLGLQDYIKFLGRLSQADVVSEFHKAQISILASITSARGNQEGIPNVLKESMSCGMAPIGTRHAGIPEVVKHNVTGLLVPEKDPSALADAIVYCIKNPMKCITMGQAARKMVEKFYDKRVVNKQLAQRLRMLIAK